MHTEILVGRATKPGHTCTLCQRPIEIGDLAAVVTEPPTRENRHVECHLRRVRS